MNKIKLVIFDMDGLMIDSESVYIKVTKNTAKQLKIPFDEKKFYKTIGTSVKDAIKIYGSIMGEKYYLTTFRDVYLKNRTEYLEKHPYKKKKGIITLLKYLKKNDIKIAVASSTYKDFATDSLTKIGAIDYIDFGLFGDAVKRSKPDPEIYLKVLKHYKDIDPSEVLVFEDSKNGLLAATNAHLKCVVIPDVCFIPKAILKKAYRIYPDLTYGIKLIKELNK